MPLTDKEKNRLKQQIFRERKAREGKHEVRGIYATPDEEKKIKDYAKKITKL